MATETEKLKNDGITPEENPNKTLEEYDDVTSNLEEPSNDSILPASESDAQKKIRRAERFGVPVQLSEQDKRNSRAERFGTGPTILGSDSLKNSEDQKRKARAERFGLPSESKVDEEKKKARLDRFATVSKTDVVEEDKRKARAIRFSETSSSVLHVDGDDNLKPKTAVAGKASGGA